MLTYSSIACLICAPYCLAMATSTIADNEGKHDIVVSVVIYRILLTSANARDVLENGHSFKRGLIVAVLVFRVTEANTTEDRLRWVS